MLRTLGETHAWKESKAFAVGEDISSLSDWIGKPALIRFDRGPCPRNAGSAAALVSHMFHLVLFGGKSPSVIMGAAIVIVYFPKQLLSPL